MIKHLVDILSTNHWALAEETFAKWQDVIEAKLKDGKVDVKAITGPAKEKPQQLYSMDGPLAVVEIVGEMYKRPTLFASGTSYGRIKEACAQVKNESGAQAAFIDFDSPGGSVAGTEGAREAIVALAKVMPVYAYTSGDMCSAAYWLGSAAHVIAARPLALVGSIGILGVHSDHSEADKKAGIKRTVLRAGSQKALGHPAEPLSDKAAQAIQSRIDEFYKAFVSDVAKGRGVSFEKALSMADGKVYSGREALKAGLIDRLSGREEFIKSIKEELIMDLKDLKAKHPELVEQIRADAREGMVAKDEAAKAGEAARDNVLGLVEAMVGGEAATKIKAAAGKGLSAQDVKDLGLIAGPDPDEGEDKARGKMLTEIEKANKEGLENNGQLKADEEKPKAEDWKRTVRKYMAEHKCTQAEAIQAIDDLHPGLREDYLKAYNAGEIKE